MNGGRQENFIIVADRDILKRLNNLWEEWIGDFRDDQAEDPALPRNQRPGLGVWIVAEFSNHLPHSLGQLRINTGDAINYPRDGCGRYSGTPCDIAHIHKLR